MRALFDTHSFLWAAIEFSRLSRTAQGVLNDDSNEFVFSSVCAWEIAIKHGLGRLDVPGDPAAYIPDRIRSLGLTPLSIEIPHAILAGGLPPYHRDPFDRLLIAQAQVERLPIITGDPNIARYDVEIIW